MKKFTSIVLVLVMVLSSSVMVFASSNNNEIASSLAPLTENDLVYTINQNLSPEEIGLRKEQIDLSYNEGELLSPEDAEFIRFYALDLTVDPPVSNSDEIVPNSIIFNTSDTATLSNGKEFLNGIVAGVFGTCGATFTFYDGTPYYWINADVDVLSGDANIDSMTLSVTGTSYIVGPTGTIKGDSSTLTHTSSSAFTVIDSDYLSSGYNLYLSLTIKLTVKSASGSSSLTI